MVGRWIVGGLVLAMFISAAALNAQRPLSPLPESGNRVAPFFDGWYQNPDGTISFSFGYSNLNKDTVEIPLGPDNFITPKEYDGRQPTSFPVVEPERPRRGGPNRGVVTGTGAGAPGAAGTTPPADPGTAGASTDPNAANAAGFGGVPARPERERGVFTVQVPAGFKDDVVWTLRYRGQTWSVPARSKSPAYQLSWPMAMGSVPPLLRFQPNGSAGRGPMGIQGPDLQARVGAPLELTVWLTDDAVHEKEPITIKREVVPSMNVTWYKHSGSVGAPVVFSPPKQGIAEAQGKAATTATFKEPGEYVIRAKADTFGNIDSSGPDQCCWTNGYWKVVVMR